MLRFLKAHRVVILLLLLIVSVSGNLAILLTAREMYAKAKLSAVFPSSTAYVSDRSSPAPKSGRRIVLFGDSRIVGWTNFPRVEGDEVIGRGVNGETTAQMRARFEQDVLALHPDVVVLQMGINDLTAIGVVPERAADITAQCHANIRYFTDSLRAAGVRTILLTIVPPHRPQLWQLPVWSNRIGSETERLNRHWIDLPASADLRVIDTQSLLQSAPGRWHDGVNADALHLTPRGYEYLNAAVLPALRN